MCFKGRFDRFEVISADYCTQNVKDVLKMGFFGENCKNQWVNSEHFFESSSTLCGTLFFICLTYIHAHILKHLRKDGQKLKTEKKGGKKEKKKEKEKEKRMNMEETNGRNKAMKPSRRGLGTSVSFGRHVAPKHSLHLQRKMRHLDPKIFHFLSLFICVRCFNPFDDGQYDIDWGGPVTLREGQVTPVSSIYFYAQLKFVLHENHEQSQALVA